VFIAPSSSAEATAAIVRYLYTGRINMLPDTQPGVSSPLASPSSSPSRCFALEVLAAARHMSNNSRTNDLESVIGMAVQHVQATLSPGKSALGSTTGIVTIVTIRKAEFTS
jgi:hypothetical protein